jgi:phosphoglycolate phosphatase-like HAD superfamily hydrolase/antitoxin (DNA-binding transcriptional repressor) of toxin-antitoxin stability system
MKTLEVVDAVAPLAEYALDLKNESVILTVDGKPVAALMAIDNADLETAILSTNSQFMALIERARSRKRTEGGVSAQEMRRRTTRSLELGSAAHIAGRRRLVTSAEEGLMNRLGITLCCVIWLVLITVALPARVQARPTPGGAPQGKLAVAITYAGDFYRETFGYAPDAPNIRHYALILPASALAEHGKDAAGVFSGLAFPAPDEDVAWRAEVAGAQDWALPYLHAAPGGTIVVPLPPGDYAVWTAFIAAPLSRAEAGVGDDAILWAGVTGGGASTRTPVTVTVAAGATTAVTFPLTDANGWACPWLYVHDGDEYVRTTEVLRTPAAEPPAPYREVTRLGRVPVVDGAVRLRLAEEKDEITTLDAFTIVANGVHLAPDGQPALAAADGATVDLAQGEHLDLTFTLPPALAARSWVQTSVTAVGFYLPVEQAADPLPSWHDGAAKQAILEFVAAKSPMRTGAEYAPPAERIATFDNDGTLWAEQPIYVQFLFALDRVKALAPANPEWQTQEPFASLLKGDLKAALAGGEQAVAAIIAMPRTRGMTTDEFAGSSRDWISTARHPVTHEPSTPSMVYQPMLEVLAHLRANGFKTYIVSGGGVEFMRPWTERVYGIPPEQVVGSSVKTAFELRDGEPVLHAAGRTEFHTTTRKGKPVAINQHIGRRPIAAFGNSDGDLADAPVDDRR